MDTETRNSSTRGAGSAAHSGGAVTEGCIHDGAVCKAPGGLNEELLTKRVVFPIAGKGGIGKTTVMAALAEWYKSQNIVVQVIDMDPENRAEGSISSLFSSAIKIPAIETWSYDRLLGISMDSPADIILADMGAAQAYRLIPWVQSFYQAAQDSGLPLRWTAVGVVDTDIASARSVLEWGVALQRSVDYMVVHNNCPIGSNSAWEDPKLAADVARFREALSPVEIRMEARRPDLQEIMRSRCVTLSDVADRKTQVRELQAPDMMLRARTYRAAAFKEFTKAHRVLLP